MIISSIVIRYYTLTCNIQYNLLSHISASLKVKGSVKREQDRGDALEREGEEKEGGEEGAGKGRGRGGRGGRGGVKEWQPSSNASFVNNLFDRVEILSVHKIVLKRIGLPINPIKKIQISSMVVPFSAFTFYGETGINVFVFLRAIYLSGMTRHNHSM